MTFIDGPIHIITNLKGHVMALISVFLLAGARSDAGAAAVARNEPMPSPVPRRNPPKAVIVVAVAVSAMPAEKQAQDVSIAWRRPTPSPMEPAGSASTVAPTSAWRPSGPAMAGVT